MRSITKQKEPTSLAQYRAGAKLDYAASYDEFPGKDELRAHLVHEQRGLCALCGGRIVNDPLKMKIAHWKPRKLKGVAADGGETFPNLKDQLSYWNMLGCCKGNEGQEVQNQHCDTSQGNQPLSKNPADPLDRIEDILSYNVVDGAISSTDQQFNADLGAKDLAGKFQVGVINLNLAFLRANRKQALDGFKQGLKKRGNLAKEQITRLLTKWSGDQPGELEAYAPIVAYYLKKRLNRESQ